MAWIKLSTRDNDPKILRIADLTGERADRVYLAAIRWFFWIDDNHKAGSLLSVTETHFNDITRWVGRKSLAEAMRHDDIQWLDAVDGRFVPSRLDSHFGSTTKQRALVAKRVRDHRERSTASGNASCNGPPLHSLVSSESGSEISLSELRKQAREKMRADCAREAPDQSAYEAAKAALTDWIGKGRPVLAGMARAIEDALDAIRDAGADWALVPRAIRHLRDKATPCKSLAYVTPAIVNTVKGREWEATVAPEPKESPKDRAARIVAKLNGVQS